MKRADLAITLADIDGAIEILQRARQQPAYPALRCAICQLGGHTAEVCAQNPLVLARRQQRAEGVWRCFFCQRVCLTFEEGVEHFGPALAGKAACLPAE